jgi:hypothetical protein
MISRMEQTHESQANTLCKSCGLCCTGHLFAWTKLRSAELDAAETLGLKVFRSVPSQRGFSQPCPLWQGQCTIYTSPHYPHFCRKYKCKLLKRVLDETTSLPEALIDVETAKGMIHELEALLPDSPNPNFRERLVARLEALDSRKGSGSHLDTDLEFQQKAKALLAFYDKVFGVQDVVQKTGEE